MYLTGKYGYCAVYQYKYAALLYFVARAAHGTLPAAPLPVQSPSSTCASVAAASTGAIWLKLSTLIRQDRRLP